MKTTPQNRQRRLSAAVIKNVLACEQRLTAAEREADGDALRCLLAREFVGVTLHGAKVGRRAFIAGFLRPELRLGKLRIDRLTIRCVDRTVIVVGRSHFSGEYAGRPIAGRGQFTDVWINRRKTWQLLASAVTRIGA